MSTDHAIRETDGHPYLLSRLFLNASSSTDAPNPLSTILEGSLGELGSSERELLHLVAVAGGPTSTAALFAAAGLPCDAAAIDQLRRRKLIQSSATPDDLLLDTYHQRVRETVLATISAERRTALSAQLVRGRLAEAGVHDA